MDAKTARTANVRLWVADVGGPAEFSRRFGTGTRWQQAQVSQWISVENPKSIGHKLAREIEVALGKDPGSMDRPPGAIQSQSLPVRLDPVILAESIAALRQVAKRRGWSYDPELHAEATCYAYELWHELPSAPSTADVIDLGERIAERLRLEMEKANGGNQQGQGSGAGADDRGQPGQAGTRKARAAGSARGA